MGLPQLASNATRAWERVTEMPGFATIAFVVVVNVALTLLTGLETLRDFPNSADEYAYVLAAETFAEGKLSVPSPDPREPFSYTHVINDGRFYGKYPPGWSFLLSFGTRAGVPWLVNPLFGAFFVIAVYAVARRHFSTPVANIAALSMVANPYVIFNAASYFSHTSCLFFCTAFFWGYLAVLSGQRRRQDSVGMGLAAGLAFLARPYTAIVIFTPLLVYLLWRASRTGTFRAAIVSLAWAALPALACFSIFLAYNYLQTGDPWVQPFQKYDPHDKPSLSGMYQDFFSRLRDHVAYRLLELGLWLPLSPLFAAAYFLTPEGRRNPKGVALELAFAGLFTGYFLYWGSGINQYGPRYLHEATGVLVLMSALLVSRYQKWNVLIVTGLLLMNISTLWTATRYHARDVDERMEVYKLAESQAVAPAVIFLKTGSGTMPIGDLTRNGIHFDGSFLYVWDSGPDMNRRLLDRHPGRRAYAYRYDRGTRAGQLLPYEP